MNCQSVTKTPPRLDCSAPKLSSISSGTMAKRVAIILAGCGVYDGTEIHEASAILVHLSRAGAKVQMFAPNAEMMHVVNHCEGKPATDKRNVMEESARIARGQITDLAKLKAADYDVLIIPGGFGAAKNLSDWATKGKEYSVKPLVEKVIKEFHQAGRPIAMCCIAPVLAAKAIPGCELTVGHDCECEKWPYAGVAKSMAELGSKHVNKNVGEVHVDKKNKLVTTSAFMCNAPVHEVYDGLGVMVTEVLKLA